MSRSPPRQRTPADRAWDRYVEHGVICPAFADEIAERTALLREWAAAGRGVR